VRTREALWVAAILAHWKTVGFLDATEANRAFDGVQPSDSSAERASALVGRMSQCTSCVCFAFCATLRLFARRRDCVEREVELLVLRHEVAILRRGPAHGRGSGGQIKRSSRGWLECARRGVALV
jgi:hypothetical protein